MRGPFEKLTFGKVKPGMCRLSMNGIAIKVGDTYKTYNVNTGALVNCADFVFDMGDDMFFVFPTNTVQKGDIILMNDGPATVIEVVDGQIKVFKYSDSTISFIVPESYLFFGNSYFYSKIVSVFGDMTNGCDLNKMMPLMFMSEMFKGNSSSSEFGKMLPFMMMSGGAFNFGDMFGGLFNSMPIPTNTSAPCAEKENE